MKNDPGPHFRTDRGDGSYALERVLDNVIGRARQTWTIRRDGRDVAVLMPLDEYERMRADLAAAS